jgi:hypothetical protein
MIMKMKYTRTLLPLTLLAFIGWGCSDKSQDQAGEAYDDAKGTLHESAEQVGDSVANAWDTVADFSAEQSARFVSTMETAYSRLESGAGNLQHEAGDLSDDAVNQYNQASEAFKDQLDKAGNASSDAWDSTKEGVGEAWNNLVEAYENLQSEATDS